MTWKLGEEEKFQRAQVLAAKVNLLLDAIVDRSGRPYDYPVIGAGDEKDRPLRLPHQMVPA